jgi:hypothetical protein
MITIILGLVLGVIIGRKLSIDSLGLFVGGLIGALIGFLIAGLIIGPSIPSTYELEEKIELVALKDNTAIRGSFFLACGSFGEEYYYRFYKREEDGALTPGKIVADEQIKIYEEERTDGILKVLEMAFYWSFWFFCS